jgi:hypothetical protein
VVALVSDTTRRPADLVHLEPCLRSLCRQSVDLPVEIIVPYHSSVEGVAEFRQHFPGVRFVKVNLKFYTGRTNSHEHHHELRSRGIDLAQGDIVALTEDHGIPAPDWCRQILEAHRQSFAGVGGGMENGIDRPLNWAVYFCDFFRYQNPVTAGESAIATDANVSYKRDVLLAIRPVWQERFYEPSVHEALHARGEKLALAPGMILSQHRRRLRLGAALRERFVWGRSYGAARGRMAGVLWRLLWTAGSPLMPLLIVVRMTIVAMERRRNLIPFLKALPLVAVLVTGWVCGEVAGYITGRSGGCGSIFSTPLDNGEAGNGPDLKNAKSLID